jgi:hypothetical protein
MSDKRQKNQLELAFTEMSRSEAPRDSGEGTETPMASRNSRQQLERVRGSDLPNYLSWMLLETIMAPMARMNPRVLAVITPTVLLRLSGIPLLRAKLAFLFLK